MEELESSGEVTTQKIFKLKESPSAMEEQQQQQQQQQRTELCPPNQTKRARTKPNRSKKKKKSRTRTKESPCRKPKQLAISHKKPEDSVDFYFSSNENTHHNHNGKYEKNSPRGIYIVQLSSWLPTLPTLHLSNPGRFYFRSLSNPRRHSCTAP